jgi:hypothetical protein
MKKDKIRYTKIGVSTTLEFGIDNISGEFGRHIYQQLVLYLNITYNMYWQIRIILLYKSY